MKAFRFLVLLGTTVLGNFLEVHAQAIVARPILFVHGFCISAADWTTPTPGLEGQVIDYLGYPGSVDASQYTNATPYVLYYDGNAVRQFPGGGDLSSIPSTALFFSINFYAPGAFGSGLSGPVNGNTVAQVSVLNKADELAHVISAIRQITNMSQVIVVGHSMGGLVARAYMQNLASPYTAFCTDGTGYQDCTPGATPYNQDISRLVTLDTPHGGAAVAGNAFLTGVLDVFNLFDPMCSFSSTLNRRELAPTSYVMTLLLNSASTLPSSTPVASIESFTEPGSLPGSAADDGIVTQSEQSFSQSLIGYTPPSTVFYDEINPFPSLPADCSFPLHTLSCLGIQPQTWSVVETEIQKAISVWSITITSNGGFAQGQTGATYTVTLTNPDPTGSTVGVVTVTESLPSGLTLASMTGQGWNCTSNTCTRADPLSAGFNYPSIIVSVAVASNASPQVTNQVRASGGGPLVATASYVTSVIANLTAQTITFGALSNATYPAAAFAISASASSGQPVTFVTTTPSVCTVSLSAVTIVSTGVCSITASQAGNSTYAAAASVTQSFVVTSPTNGFSLQVNPTSSSARVGGATTYLVTSAITSGSATAIALNASNTPAGVTWSFNPSSVNSGSTSTLTLSVGSNATTGTFSFSVSGTGSQSSTATQASLTITAAASSAPTVTLMPSSQIFPTQSTGTVGPPQTMTIRNSGTGGGQLKISSVYSANSDFTITQEPNISQPINSLGSVSFQVSFTPVATGQRNGQIYIYDNAAGSPHVISLTGTGLAPQSTTGTIQVSINLNGLPLPQGNWASYTLSGPSLQSDTVPSTFTVTQGTYTLSFGGTPSVFILASISPSATQTVNAGGSISFTMNFTASNDFTAPYFAGAPGSNNGPSPQAALAGTSATYYVTYSYPNGSAQTPITLQLLGGPPGTSATFTNDPDMTDQMLSATTPSTSPPGAYTISVSGTNSSGLTRLGANTSTLFVTAVPAQSPQLVSVNSTGVQGNAGSNTGGPQSVSASGRYVAFSSGATNLAAGTSGIFVRDVQGGTTTFVSLDPSGNPVPFSGGAAISADGQSVAFQGGASQNSVYLRDLQTGTSEQIDVAINGTSPNGPGFGAAISADGRFVAFESFATNLVAGVTAAGQIYVRDRKLGQTFLASAASDGSPANESCNAAAISADGRFVSFVTASTNLSSQNLNGLSQSFVRDLQAGQTTLASTTNDGTPVSGSILYSGGGFGPPAMSADGRYLVFECLCANLVPPPAVGNAPPHLFLRDLQAQQTAVVDADSSGNPLGGIGGSGTASISADGRFVAYQVFNHIVVRDMLSNQSEVVSTAGNGTPGNGASSIPSMSPGGSVVVFGSLASNLVSGDTNGASDVFSAPNPFIGSPYVQSLALSTSFAGSLPSITGTVLLSAAAPSSGINIVLSVNNSLIQVPAVVLVPGGATTATFSLSASPSQQEIVATIIASYNGGSAVGLLTIEPAQLSITSSHSGSFTIGQMGASYTLTVANNASAGTTNGAVTVTETVPVGLTLVSMSGTFWGCSIATGICSAGLPLAAGVSYPPITVTVNVATDAPAQVTNQASVTGGGSGSATAADTTVISYATYLVGDVFPYTSDSVGNFGDGTINTLDLISTLRAVVNLTGFVPATCSDRFDAMDSYPLDTPTTRGGDGMLNTLDLIETLRRATNIDASRPTRSSRALTCPNGAASPQSRSAVGTPSEGSLEFGTPVAIGGGWRIPILLRAKVDLDLQGLSFSAGYDSVAPGTQLDFVAAGQPPGVMDRGLPGMIAIAWLEGWRASSGEVVELGHLETSGSAETLRLYGVSANAVSGGRTVVISLPQQYRKPR